MKENFVINLGRELGSGGRIIGEKLAERLGIDFYDKKLIELAAKQSGISDEVFARVDESSSHSPLATLVSYLRNPFAGGEGSANSVLNAEALFAIQSDVIRDVAACSSALFVGRCADYILRDHPRAISVFITANKEDRVKRIMELYKVDESEAENMISRGDSSRADYYNFYTTSRWGHASTYDLCINSSILGVEGTVDYIAGFVKNCNL